MVISILLNLLIMVMWIITGTMSFNFYVSKRENHFLFKLIFTISSLNLLGVVLAFPHILEITSEFQSVRWTIFSFLEIMMMNMFLRTTSIRRPWELILTALFMTVVLVSTVYFNVIFNVIISALLFFTAIRSSERLVRKYYSVSMIAYALTSIIPNIFGFTGSQSLAIGCLFSWTFLWASWKIYNHEKINDKLKEMIMNGEL